MPNQPKTPARTHRIPDEIYLPFKALAESEGKGVSELVREVMAERVKQDTLKRGIDKGV